MEPCSDLHRVTVHSIALSQSTKAETARAIVKIHDLLKPRKGGARSTALRFLCVSTTTCDGGEAIGCWGVDAMPSALAHLTERFLPPPKQNQKAARRPAAVWHLFLAIESILAAATEAKQRQLVRRGLLARLGPLELDSALVGTARLVLPSFAHCEEQLLEALPSCEMLPGDAQRRFSLVPAAAATELANDVANGVRASSSTTTVCNGEPHCGTRANACDTCCGWTCVPTAAST